MVKKKDNNLLMWGIIIVVVILFLKLDWSKPTVTQVSQFVDKEKSNTELGTNLGGGNTEVSSKNLCSLMTPYVFVFNLQNLCISNGGMWICNQGNIGCYTMMEPMIDCNLAVIKTALNQCSSTGGKSYCDTKTVYCKY